MAEPPSNPRKGNSRSVAPAHKAPGYTYPKGNLKWPSSRVEPIRRPAQVGTTRTNRRRTPQERASNEPGAELLYTRGSSWTRRGDGHAETPPIAQGRAGSPDRQHWLGIEHLTDMAVTGLPAGFDRVRGRNSVTASGENQMGPGGRTKPLQVTTLHPVAGLPKAPIRVVTARDKTRR